MAKRRIHSKGPAERDELIAAAAISPGMLLERVAAGTVQAHSAEGGYAERMFAEEDALQGDTVSDAYAAADPVAILKPQKGSEVNALLAAGYSYTIGMELISAGDGTLIPNGQEASATTVEDIIAVCAETEDLSDSGDANTLVKVVIR